MEGGPHSGKENTSNIPGQQNSLHDRLVGEKPIFPPSKLGLKIALRKKYKTQQNKTKKN